MGADDGLLGSFEEQVLLAVVQLGDRAYGMRVRREIEDRTGREVSIGAVYATLDRLAKKGLIETRLESGDQVRSGRARKMVRVSPEGAESLRRAREQSRRMWEGIDLSTLPGGGA